MVPIPSRPASSAQKVRGFYSPPDQLHGGVLATGSGINRLEPGRVGLGERDVAALLEPGDVEGAAQVEQFPAGSGRPDPWPDGIEQVARCARATDRMTVDSRPPDLGPDVFHRLLQR